MELDGRPIASDPLQQLYWDAAEILAARGWIECLDNPDDPDDDLLFAQLADTYARHVHEFPNGQTHASSLADAWGLEREYDYERAATRWRCPCGAGPYVLIPGSAWNEMHAYRDTDDGTCGEHVETCSCGRKPTKVYADQSNGVIDAGQAALF